MSRITSRLLALAGLLALIAPSVVFAQGVLIDVRPDHRWRIPPPIIRPMPLPPTSYKIKEIAVLKLIDSKSSVTALIVLWRTRCWDSEGGTWSTEG